MGAPLGLGKWEHPNKDPDLKKPVPPPKEMVSKKKGEDGPRRRGANF